MTNSENMNEEESIKRVPPEERSEALQDVADALLATCEAAVQRHTGPEEDLLIVRHIVLSPSRRNNGMQIAIGGVANAAFVDAERQGHFSKEMAFAMQNSGIALGVSLLTKLVPLSPLDAFLAGIQVLKTDAGEERAREIMLHTLTGILGCSHEAADLDGAAALLQRILEEGPAPAKVH